MSNTDPRSISEIVDDNNLADSNEDATDEPEELDEAKPKNAPFTPLPATLESALRNAPSIQEARTAAHIPPQLTVKELVGRPIVIADKTPQKAALPDTGEMRNGYQCYGAFQDDESPFTVWIGQVALLSDLERIRLPFRTTLTRRGRTYQFG